MAKVSGAAARSFDGVSIAFTAGGTGETAPVFIHGGRRRRRGRAGEAEG